MRSLSFERLVAFFRSFASTVLSPVVTSVLFVTLSQADEGVFEILHSSPILQDITRISFLAPGSAGEPWIHFSTLESYHRNTDGDRFLLISSSLGSKNHVSQIIEGSTEGRSWGYSDSRESFVIGASLDPQILLFNPRTREIKSVFKGPSAGMWIHRLAVFGNCAYTIFSTPLPSVAGFEGIVKVDLESGQHEVIPFDSPHPQGYGGVETVDPTGRLWFYRSFPLKKMWYDQHGGMRLRSLIGYETWTVEGWDVWKGQTYVLLTNSKGDYKKERIDLETLRVLAPEPGALSDDQLFRRCVRVDLPQNRYGLYFDPSSHAFYLNQSDDLLYLGQAALGRWRVSGFSNETQESFVHWLHPIHGEIEVLGLSPKRELVVWLRGRKTYGVVNFGNGELTLRPIHVQNLSAGTVTSLALAENGKLYGGGYLTMCHLFEFDLVTRNTRLLNSALPNMEGQINSLFTGLDGKIYGAGYPDSILFRFDPTRPWNPGSDLKNNPVNLGPMGHFRQMRAFRGVQDLDGRVWYQSVSDFTNPIAHALACAEFDDKSLRVKTDLEDGFPEVQDLALFDDRHLVLLGKRGNSPGLFLLDEKTFTVVRSVSLPYEGGILLHRNPLSWRQVRPLLVQKGTVYEINEDLSRTVLYRSPKDVARVVVWDMDSVVLIGKTHIEQLDLKRHRVSVWWNMDDAARHPVFKELTWTPVAVFKGALYLADQEKLLKFTPPQDSVSPR